jgi:hypothetical protein
MTTEHHKWIFAQAWEEHQQIRLLLAMITQRRVASHDVENCIQSAVGTRCK